MENKNINEAEVAKAHERLEKLYQAMYAGKDSSIKGTVKHAAKVTIEDFKYLWDKAVDYVVYDKLQGAWNFVRNDILTTDVFANTAVSLCNVAKNGFDAVLPNATKRGQFKAKMALLVKQNPEKYADDLSWGKYLVNTDQIDDNDYNPAIVNDAKALL